MSLFIGRMKGRPGWAVTPQVMCIKLYAFSLEKRELLPLEESSLLSPGPYSLHNAVVFKCSSPVCTVLMSFQSFHSGRKPLDWFSVWKPQTYSWRHLWCILISPLAIYCILNNFVASFWLSLWWLLDLQLHRWPLEVQAEIEELPARHFYLKLLLLSWFYQIQNQVEHFSC